MSLALVDQPLAQTQGGFCLAPKERIQAYRRDARTAKELQMTFSVIVPFYNLETYARDAVESVLAQTFTDFECICVDDGSTDCTPAILDEFAALDRRVKVIHKPNGGEGSARNAGLEIAAGDWICYLDGDDIWAPDALADFAAAIGDGRPVDMVSVGQVNFKDGERCAFKRDQGRAVWYDTSHLLDAPLFMIGVWSTTYRREVFGDLRFTDYCIGADRIYTMKCLCRSTLAAVLPYRDYGYRLRSGSMAHAPMDARKIFSCIDFSRECLRLLALSGKTVPSPVRRNMTVLWMEVPQIRIADVESRVERNLLFAAWLKSVASCDFISWLSIWYACIVRLLRICAGAPLVAKMLARFLCLTPYRVKTIFRRRRRR